MTGFFAILDDIAALMDDVSVMAKVAAKKTAGILGDDLAVGAKQASEFKSSREIPVLWAITKGSFINKLIILPFAFLLTSFASQLIVPILLLGGIYLSYEGVEKIIHTFFKKHSQQIDKENAISKKDIVREEKIKIKTTIITDFILSIEIIMIALGTVTEEPLSVQIMVVSIIAIVATIGVYGIVALMIRMDDVGLKMINRTIKKKNILSKFFIFMGKGLIWSLPKLIQILAVVGTLAMLLVGGGMFVHNIHQIHDFFGAIPVIITELIMGMIVGFLTYLIIELFYKIKGSSLFQ